MDRQLIRSLIDALAKSDLSELEYTVDGATLRLVKGEKRTTGTAAPSATPPTRPGPTAPLPEMPPRVEPHAATVAAPAYGIVHLHRTPGAPPLVAAGDTVAAGQVLCLIEAMKVFTELRAERAGTVTTVLVDTGQEVEAGQPLFRMEP